VGLLDEVRPFPGPTPRLGDAIKVVAVRGAWEAGKLLTLLRSAHSLPEVKVFAEVDVAELAAVDAPERALRDYLETGTPPLWASQHRGIKTVKFGGTVSGRSGTLVSIVDSIPPLADNRRHLQPVTWLVASLRRDSGLSGVVLFVVPDGLAGDAVRLSAGAGLRSELWDYFPARRECLRP
jgi:hypothetical protein